MRRGERVILGDVNEVPMPVLTSDQVRDAVAACDCRGVARRGDLVVKVSARALQAVEAASKAVAPLTCGGVLLGVVSQVGETWLVEVREALPFNATPEVHRVRVSRHAWQDMLSARGAQHPQLRVIGWYHSHPGVGVSFSEADAFVQRYFFPADWQVACVIDPERRDTQFFSRRGRNVSPLGAFWVERAAVEARAAPTSPPAALRTREGGAQMAQQSDDVEGQQASDAYLKERFVERSLEKILRLLKEPPLTARDFVMIGLMALMLVVLVFTRMGASSTAAELKEIATRLDAISQRLEALQPEGGMPAPRKPANAPRGAASGGPSTAPRIAPSAGPSVGASGDAAHKAPLDSEPDVEYTVKDGESLWSLSIRFYGDGSLQTPLMRYNKIRDARDVKAGAIIKVPAVSKLKASRSGAGGIDVPPPTPH